MKKLFLPILAGLLFLTGCSDPLNDGKPREVAITVTVPAFGTRSEIADDLTAVKWATGDCIGVATNVVYNYCLGLDASTAGTPEGVFRGTITNGVQSVYFTRGLSPLSGGFDPNYREAVNVKGDANNDGKLDKKDISATVKHIVTGKTEGFNIKNADMNNDSKVNAADIVKLINEINSPK